jgi:hypothetical protein
MLPDTATIRMKSQWASRRASPAPVEVTKKAKDPLKAGS